MKQATYIGDIVIGCGQMIAVAFCVLYTMFSFKLIKRRRTRVATLKEMYALYICSSIMFLGIFLHYYNNSARTFSAVVMWFIISKFRYEKKQNRF